MEICDHLLKLPIAKQLLAYLV